MQIPILTILFISFLVFVSYRFKMSDKNQADLESRFWEKERMANATRKKDISNLNYIIIPDDLFPLNLNSEAESSISALLGKKMLNLTGKSNADVKIEYGMQNFDEISSYDDNFSQFVKLVPSYASELLASGQIDDAQRILEFAVDCKADSRAIFKLLGDIYVDQKLSANIVKLVDIAEELDSLSKDLIIKDLNALLS